MHFSSLKRAEGGADRHMGHIKQGRVLGAAVDKIEETSVMLGS